MGLTVIKDIFVYFSKLPYSCLTILVGLALEACFVTKILLNTFRISTIELYNTKQLMK